MQLRLVSLNMNHQTKAKDIPNRLVEGLTALRPSLLCLNEFVEGNGRESFYNSLKAHGLRYIVSTESIKRDGRGWHNQILIASRFQTDSLIVDVPMLTPKYATNLLLVETCGIRVGGVRALPFDSDREWRSYWSWLGGQLNCDVAIGDFNADPARNKPRDRVFLELANSRNFSVISPSDGWSYFGRGDTRSRIDHALLRNGWRHTSAKYVTDPFVTEGLTDHAALVIDIQRD